MKKNLFLAALLGGSLVAFNGCKKAEVSAPPPGSIQMAGVNIDLPKLDSEFQNASPELQSAVTQIKTSFRGGRFVRMITELDKLSSNPSLTEPQKKVVNDVIDQMKQLIAKIPGTPG